VSPRWPVAMLRAADDAEAEAAQLYAEFKRAMILAAESDALFEAADDAYWAWRRAKDRAKPLRQLADHEEGVYNAFEDRP
jgi:hypothetical protein